MQHCIYQFLVGKFHIYISMGTTLLLSFYHNFTVSAYIPLDSNIFPNDIQTLIQMLDISQ